MHLMILIIAVFIIILTYFCVQMADFYKGSHHSMIANFYTLCIKS